MHKNKYKQNTDVSQTKNQYGEQQNMFGDYSLVS